MKVRYLLAALILLAFFGCKGEKSPGETPVKKIVETELAWVNDQLITTENFINEASRLPSYKRSLLATYEGKAEFLNELVNRELLREEAIRRGIHKDPGIVQQLKELETRLRELQTKLTVDKLMEIITEEAEEIDEDRIKDYYKDHKKEFHHPELIRASQILVKVAPDADPATEENARARAERILMELKAGGDFAVLAKKYSDDPAAANEGDLGYINRDTLGKELAEAAFSLKKVGDISGLVRSQEGFYIIALTDRKPETVLSLDESRDQIRRKLKYTKRKDYYDNLIAKLRKEAEIAENLDLLKKIELPPTGNQP